MCGIYGVVSLVSGQAPDSRVLERMGAVTAHRGPDDQGALADGSVALGMRRLSIIDVAGGHQPIPNEDRSLWVVCNGEIYNFRELRTRLERAGHRFATRSDSEVIVHAYEEFGDGFLEHLGGMFGFALWDASRRRLLLARDRLGIKPLYYHVDDGRRIAFASEAKAILQLPGWKTAIDPTGLRQYLALGYAPAPWSLFQGIRKLPAASVLVVENGGFQVRRYWTLPQALDEELTEEQWVERLRAALERAVASQMVSDVPIGAFLSGGIDSSLVVGLMSRHSTEPVRTYSIGFDTGEADRFYNELPFARAVAQRFGTRHREILVRPDVVDAAAPAVAARRAGRRLRVPDHVPGGRVRAPRRQGHPLRSRRRRAVRRLLPLPRRALHAAVPARSRPAAAPDHRPAGAPVAGRSPLQAAEPLAPGAWVPAGQRAAARAALPRLGRRVQRRDARAAAVQRQRGGTRRAGRCVRRPSGG
jgi:asparagine synthase (glutamine-hydrolysing)